jgi:hypothetical protein
LPKSPDFPIFAILMGSGITGVYKMKITKRAGMALVMALVLLAWSGIARSGEIHDAAEAGDVAKVKALLAGNPNLVNAKDDHGDTPLHWAVRFGYKDLADLLWQHGGVE